MKMKGIVSILLSIVMMLSCVLTTGAVNSFNGLLYSEDANPSLLKITGLSAELSDMTVLAIPSFVYGKEVVKIDRSAFSRTANIQGFTFSNNLLTISDNAMFAMPDLLEITLPKNISYVGRSAFASCAALKNVTFYTENLSVIRKYSFFNCPALESVVLSKSVFQLEERCFANCPGLQKIYIPSSVRNIDDTAFENTENVTIYGMENSAAYLYAQDKNIPFVCIDQLDYTQIDNLLADIKIMTFDGSVNFYTADTFSNLMSTYEAAQNIRNNILSSQTDIDNITASLQNSYHSLVLNNISDLQQTINNAQDYESCLYQYTVSSAENFQNALINARNTLYSESKTYYQVQDNIDILSTCINALESVIKGDINGDRHIRLQDVVFIQRYLLGITSFDDRMSYCADFDNDGTVTISDIILIQRYIIQN